MTSHNESIEQRLNRLEAIEAIKQLKARYFSACDRKQIDIMRDCFASGDIHIDYGIVGTFKHRDELVTVFDQQGNHPHIIEMHHGQNPQIEIINDDYARADWQLYYHQINSQTQQLTQLGGFYHDEYRLIDGQWLISSTIFTVVSSLISAINDGQYQALFAGLSPPTPHNNN